jgi:hypothetical protein
LKSEDKRGKIYSYSMNNFAESKTAYFYVSAVPKLSLLDKG